MCDDMEFLNRRKLEAWGNRDHHRVQEMNREIAAHEQTCPICALGGSTNILASNWFALTGKVVIVLPAAKEIEVKRP